MPPQPHYDPLFARPPGTWRLSMPRPTGIPGYQVWGRMGHPFFSEELDTDVFGNDDCMYYVHCSPSQRIFNAMFVFQRLTPKLRKAVND